MGRLKVIQTITTFKSTTITSHTTATMQKAKQAAASFLSKDGKHKTTVDQDVNAAVTEEHVKPTQHENVTTAVDREVHQDHHQTRVQPVLAKETLPETSSHNVAPVMHKEFDHGNAQEVRSKLDKERANFASTSTTHDTTHTTTMAPAVTGERIHHHVHEHIQPVVQKETIAPHVVHTTVPVHETHHAAPIHHEATTLPAKTLEEFQSGGNMSLEGKTTSTLREFEGCPGPYNKEKDLPNTALHPSSSGSKSSAYSENMSADGSYTHSTSAKTGGMNTAGTGSTLDSTVPRSETTGTSNAGGVSGTTETRKPSLMDKLNPRVDADGDGKKGILK